MGSCCSFKAAAMSSVSCERLALVASAKVFCTKNAPSTVNANMTAIAQKNIVANTRCDRVRFPWGATTTGYSSNLPAVEASVSAPSGPSSAEGSARR